MSNPDVPAVISGPDTPAVQAANRQTVINGSGLAVIAAGARGLEIHGAGDPSDTYEFLTRIDTPGDAQSVAIAGGIAFVADGSAGLQVINYLSFDNQGVPPTVAITSPIADVDPADGTQIVEGSSIPIRVSISDDVQLRNAELLVNGQVVANDVSLPFDFVAVAPLLASGATSVSIQVRAIDTGGNVGLSDVLVLQIVPDSIAPTIVGVSPEDNSKRGQAFRLVVVRFSEPMNTSTLTADNIQLIGPSGLVSPVDLQFRAGDRSVQLTYPLLEDGVHQIVLDANVITDRAGNPLETGQITSDFSIVEATNVWINPAGGFWDDPDNWDAGVVPGPTNDVLIDVLGDVTITYRTGDTEIRSLSSNNKLTLTGGTLMVAQTVQVNNTLTLNGGTLADATVLAGTGGEGITVTAHPGNRLSGVTVNGDLDLTQQSSVVRLNNVVLNRTAHLANSSSLAFEGTQTFASGVIQFEDNTNNVIEMAAPGTLTIGAAASIRGGTGTVGGSRYFGQQMTLVNEGLISAEVPGQAITVQQTGGSFTNSRTLEAKNGGSLTLNNLTNPHGGTIAAGVGSTVTINGGLTQTAAATMNVDIGGTSASQFGRIAITGAANLAGTLNATFANAFTPNVGDSFQVLTYSSRTGSFTAVNAVNLPGGQTLNPVYDPSALTLVDVAALAASGTGALTFGRSSVTDLATSDLTSLATAAVNRWIAAGLPSSEADRLRAINIQVAELPGAYPGLFMNNREFDANHWMDGRYGHLAQNTLLFLHDRTVREWSLRRVFMNNPGYLGFATASTIWIDRDAAGYGWFIDSTPGTDEEFEAVSGKEILDAKDGEAMDKFDLLTALEHEFGHALGLEHDDIDEDLLAAFLDRGTRCLATADAVDLVMEGF